MTGLGGGAASLFRASGGGGLYDFQDATFTNGTVTGYQGPSLAQARSGMSGTSANNFKNNTSFFNVTNGQQYWTVPIDGTYRITATGAGMWDHRQGGYGASLRGDFALTQGEIIRILVGQTGPVGGGAAGGSFVVRSPYTTNGSILVIAGGGGGGHSNGFQSNSNANSGTSGRQASTPGGNGAGGSSGQGGQGTNSGGGGGFFSNGGDGGGTGSGGRAYVNGGYGGNESSDVGGFGGGGTSGNSHGGGGGGYSGGGGSGGNPWHGGGGGSYNNGSNQVASEGAVSGNSSSVIIQLIA